MAKKKSGEEVINHYGAIRLRINGAANLLAKFWSLDEVFQTTLLPVPVIAATNVEPNRLANFTQQRAKLELRTIEIDEIFQISKIIIFVKPVAKSFPELT